MLVVTAVTGSNPSGVGSIAADPNFDGQQSVQVHGTGFKNGLVAFIVGPNGWQAVHWPQVQNINDIYFDMLAKFPERGVYEILVANVDGELSIRFDFEVK